MRPDIISIHAPPRGATALTAIQICPAHFNSRPSARGDLHEPEEPQDANSISIHAPPRGATSVELKMDAYINEISIHAPPRGATRQRYTAANAENFNSRPSARGDSGRRRKEYRRFISIHAPPRGATQPREREGIRQSISIHAPPRGATVLTLDEVLVTAYISIHAPPRGATSIEAASVSALK